MSQREQSTETTYSRYDGNPENSVDKADAKKMHRAVANVQCRSRKKRRAGERARSEEGGIKKVKNEKEEAEATAPEDAPKTR